MQSRLLARIGAGTAAALLVGALVSVPAGASPDGDEIVISEFRFRGPNGGNDEFVELLNPTSGPIDISGYQLRGCSASGSAVPSTRATVHVGVTLGAGEHFLFGNTGTSGGPYSGSTKPDATYSTGVSDGGGAVLADAEGTTVDAVGATTTSAACREGAGLTFPTSNGENAFERLGGGAQDTDDNVADFDGPKTSDPQNLSGETVEDPEPAVTKIHDIQGAGSSTPMSGQTVTIEGIVTGWDDEDGANFSRTFPEDRGIFVQEEPGDADSNPATSEGIFVGFVNNVTDYPLGSVVRVTGEAKEKFGFTMIAEAFGQEPERVGSALVALPSAVSIDVAQAESQDPDERAYYETLEGMRVHFEAGTANSGGTNKFGEVFMTPGLEHDRVFRTETEPALLATDADAGAGDPPNPFKDDDGSTTLVEADLFDTVIDVVGPLAFSFSHYKVMVQEGLLPTVVDGPTEFPYSGVAPAGERELRVASFNVENFLPVGAELDLSPVSQEEYDEKLARLTDAINNLLRRPDVIGVQEVGTLESLQELAASLGGYSAYLESGNDERGIDVGFLVKNTVEASNVVQHGKDATHSGSASCSDVDGGLFDRPPLSIDIEAGKLDFTVFTNHFSSKSAPDECRAAQAAFVLDRVEEIESAGGEVIVLGDLNAFEDESALTTLEDGTTSLDNLWNRTPAEERYSFAFSGKLQTLDHILLTEGLRSEFVDFQYSHFDNDYFERSDGHHVSDHDPPMVTLATPQKLKQKK